MVHGEEKARDMARSLLPSTGRKGTRWHKAHIHRVHRHQVREQMWQLTRDPELFEERADFKQEPTGKIRTLVRERRESDKVAPFLRWATAQARSMPRDHRMGHIRTLVPRGLIGDHALSHLRHQEVFMSSGEFAITKARQARQAHRTRPVEVLWGKAPGPHAAGPA